MQFILSSHYLRLVRFSVSLTVLSCEPSNFTSSSDIMYMLCERNTLKRKKETNQKQKFEIGLWKYWNGANNTKHSFIVTLLEIPWSWMIIIMMNGFRWMKNGTPVVRCSLEFWNNVSLDFVLPNNVLIVVIIIINFWFHLKSVKIIRKMYTFLGLNNDKMIGIGMNEWVFFSFISTRVLLTRVLILLSSCQSESQCQI